MSEFARYLVAGGITSSRFTDIARIAFYRAASVDARFRNKRLNQSALAAMTGLTRVQVRGLSKQDRERKGKRLDRIERIVHGWTADPAFLTSKDSPKRLSIGNRAATFNLLVRKYGDDVPARSVLRELIRTGCVTVRERLVSLNPKIVRTVAQNRLQYLSQSLVGLLKEPAQRSDYASQIRTHSGEVLYHVASAKGRILMEKRIETSVGTLMANLKAAGEATALELPPEFTRAGLVTRTRLVLISEELNCKRRQ
jgi:hypothetical protein